MSDFDPYHKWLGIPKSEQPANHYRLLGVALFENDPEAIEAAADQRMIYVQQMANGPHAALSQQILNELAAARVCLLKPEKKAAYDRRLRAAIRIPKSSQQRTPANSDDPKQFGVPLTSGGRSSNRNFVVVAASVVGIGGVGLILILWLLLGSADRNGIVDQKTGDELPEVAFVTTPTGPVPTPAADGDNLSATGDAKPVEVQTQDRPPLKLTPAQDQPVPTDATKPVMPKIREPEWLAVTELKVDTHKALLAMSQSRYWAPDVDTTRIAVVGPKPAAEKTDDPNQLQLDNPGSVQSVTPQPAAQSVPQQVAPFGTDFGLGFRYAAVRGIFPLKYQIDRLDRALYTNSAAKAAEFFELMDFQLQRQEAIYDPAGPAINWDNFDWEPVDMDVARKVLTSVERFDPEVVDNALTDPVVTMPLPARLVYRWGFHGSHPHIKQLGDEQRDAQRRIDELVMEQYQKQAEAQAKEQPAQKRGFAPLLQDARQIRKDVLGGQQGEQLKQKIRQEVEKEMGKNVNTTVSLAGDLVLFRFFDFTVEPGKAYRYRVRLVVRNPNSNRRPEELMDAAFMVGDTRTTPWSEPSEEKIVENDIHYFVTRVEPARGPLDVNATISVYQWFNEAGTTVKAEFKRLGLGQPIGGETTADVLRPAVNQLNRDESINLATDAILVDIAEAPELNPTLHEDLKIEDRKGPEIPAVIVVVRGDGSLRMIDTLTSQEQLRKAEASRQMEFKEHGGAQIQQQQARTALDRALDTRSGKGSTKSDKKAIANPLRKP